jgi:hypothetical protein
MPNHGHLFAYDTPTLSVQLLLDGETRAAESL